MSECTKSICAPERVGIIQGNKTNKKQPTNCCSIHAADCDFIHIWMCVLSFFIYYSSVTESGLVCFSQAFLLITSKDKKKQSKYEKVCGVVHSEPVRKGFVVLSKETLEDVGIEWSSSCAIVQ